MTCDLRGELAVFRREVYAEGRAALATELAAV